MLTNTPATWTGSRRATGVIAPVRPTWNSTSRTKVICSCAGNLKATAQRGALDWWKKFRDATKPVFEELYREVAAGNEAQRSIDLNSKPDYREKLNEELREMRESEMWQTGAVVRKLRPENN